MYLSSDFISFVVINFNFYLDLTAEHKPELDAEPEDGQNLELESESKIEPESELEP